MPSTLRYSCSLLFVLMAIMGQAQVDTLKVKPEKDWKPSMIRPYWNLARTVGSATKDFRNSGEVGIEFDTHNFLISAEGGIETNHRVGENYDYTNSGTYWRVGIENNFIPWSKERNTATLGIRYAQSRFSDEIVYETNSLFFQDINALELRAMNEKVKASWLELSGGIKVRVWKELYLGATVRVKTRKRVSDTDELIPYDIPGFGRHKKNGVDVKDSNAGFDYYVAWRFGFREKEIPKKLDF
ncbi:MAG: hypothetical protein JXQ90_12580 [Cyclobacteriaceae bacterium]